MDRILFVLAFLFFVTGNVFRVFLKTSASGGRFGVYALVRWTPYTTVHTTERVVQIGSGTCSVEKAGKAVDLRRGRGAITVSENRPDCHKATDSTYTSGYSGFRLNSATATAPFSQISKLQAD